MIREAAWAAVRLGVPLNRHITVHWGIAGFCDAEAGPATRALLKLMSDRARARGWRFAFVYAREHDPASGKGPHVHILAHVPAREAVAFTARQRAWLRRVTGRPYHRGVIHSRPIGPTVATYEARPDLYALNLGAAVAYLVKGASPEAAAALGLRRLEPSGPVTGKRAGRSAFLR
jgi:hypothetical protein